MNIIDRISNAKKKTKKHDKVENRKSNIIVIFVLVMQFGGTAEPLV